MPFLFNVAGVNFGIIMPQRPGASILRGIGRAISHVY